MKKFLFVFLYLSLIFNVLKMNSQTNDIASGYPIVHLFSNVSMDMNQEKKAGFGITRAYIGYHYQMTEGLSARAIIDASIPNPNSSKNDIFLKNAFITWNKNDKVIIDAGLLCLRQFIHVQENWWGGRYIYNTITDRIGMFNGADYGLDIQYTPNKYMAFDFTFSNGEGFKSVNIDNSFKYDLGVTFTPNDNLVMRAVGEVYNKSEDIVADTYTGSIKNQYISALFLGYKLNKIRTGVEAAYLWNKGFLDGRNTFCYSVYANYKLIGNLNVLARYDKVKSYQKNNDVNDWNSTDGDLCIVGLEYIINKRLRVSPNFRWSNSSIGKNTSLFINMEFKL